MDIHSVSIISTTEFNKKLSITSFDSNDKTVYSCWKIAEIFFREKRALESIVHKNYLITLDESGWELAQIINALSYNIAWNS